ncbi:putative transposase [Haladaptatus litoreus]|uniref:Putative transposase n=1 Tax=Haladaptatus litoreus TaxID=553468 RepID=A0A1N7DKR7_9EURY|nr:RNA-guided endonuclease TnpB family protein [Haladaptatus litoreus]SIR76387.1 putative transposase [Haladaptatus litoreus]
MRRVNSFEVAPRTNEDEELLRRLLDASASLWNQLNYERRQNFTDPDIDKSVWDTEDYRKQYVSVLGSATAQQVIRKNSEAWRSFFSLKEKGEDNGLPGYWGNEEKGRILRIYIRNDQYSVRWSNRSTVELTVGKALKDEYDMGYREKLCLNVKGKPKWSGDQGRLELYYDETSNQYRAIQPVTIDDSRLDSPLADHSAALDIGASNLVACTTTTGQQYLYHGRDLFERFRETTRRIAELQSKLRNGRYSSKQIRSLYRGRTKRRNHAMDALARNLMGLLYSEGVSTVYVGDLTDVLETHWSVQANHKTHNFWAFRAFINRLTCTAEEFGITVEVRSEAWTSQTCPNCGSTTDTTRHQDTLTCPCGFEGHADLVASETFLRRYENVVRPMARPVRFKWDDHSWSAIPHAHRPNEQRTHPKVTTGESA